MEQMTALVRSSHEAMIRRDWPTAYAGFTAARCQGALSADDVYALGDAAWWLGSFNEALACYEEAYALYLREDRPRPAALTAFGIGTLRYMRGDTALGSGWVSRALRILQKEPEGAEHAYLLIMDMELAFGEGNFEAALAKAKQLQDKGGHYADPNLVALGVLGEGRALMRQGKVREGIALLDEAMLAALSDRLAPEWAGNIYCQLMQACHELADLRRAREWTQATAHWCESLSAAGPFLGICRVHRAQVFQIQGDWDEAEREAKRVSEELIEFDLATVGEAHYQLGEIHRLRGDFADAEEAFRQAHQCGRDPQPGQALLQLAQRRARAAAATIQTALAAHAQDRLARARLCLAQVEIALAAADLKTARSAEAELRETAALYGSSGLEAAALQATGAVLIAEGRPETAIGTLQTAARHWQQLNAPYECAKSRVLLARAYEDLSDHDSAARERGAATEVFERLGATPDLREATNWHARPALPDGLTEREAEVLALVASGRTNRQIAAELVISEKTVARHLANIFTKLGLASRTAAAAYAFTNGLARRGPG